MSSHMRFSEETLFSNSTNSFQNYSLAESIIGELISDDASVKGKLNEILQITQKLEKYISDKKNENISAIKKELKMKEDFFDKIKHQEAKANEIEIKYVDEKAKSQQLLEENEELKDRIHDLETALKEKRNYEIEHLNKELENQQKILDMYKHREVKVKELRTKYTNEMDKSQKLLQENANLEERIQNLETSLNKKAAEMKIMETNMAKEHNKFEKIKSELLSQVAQMNTKVQIMTKEQAKHDKIKAEPLLQESHSEHAYCTNYAKTYKKII